MNFSKLLLFVLSVLTSYSSVFSQKIELLTQGQDVSIRGLSVVDDQVVWASGTNGTVGKSLDGGKSWKWIVVKGFEKTDFRDVEAFDDKSAVIMGIASPGFILRTEDGGDNWSVVYENRNKDVFMDAMDFYDDAFGTVIGDPIDGKIFVARTFDAGRTWRQDEGYTIPPAMDGEAFFAASGTNIRLTGARNYYFVSGGLRSRVFGAGKAMETPLLVGQSSTGAFSIAINKSKKLTSWVVVGGDYSKDQNRDKNCYISHNEGVQWFRPLIPPFGFRSCVEFLSSKKLITCGTSGVDVSDDGGIRWENISTEGFHVCRKAKKGKAVFLAGSNGRIGKLIKF